MDSLEDLKGDSVVILEYHGSDGFGNDDATGRSIYYWFMGVPYARFDGRDSVLGAWDGVLNQYLDAYNAMMELPSSCTLNVMVNYDCSTRRLWAEAEVFAVDAIPYAYLRYAIAESHIPHQWQWLDSLHHVVRKMLPDFNGVYFDIDQGESFVDSQSYVLDSTWNDKNCYVVVFVQRDEYGPIKPIYGSVKSDLFQPWVFGDANGDGDTDGADAIYLINYLFVNGPTPCPLAKGDPNNDCIVNTADVIYLINHLFVGGPAPQVGCA